MARTARNLPNNPATAGTTAADEPDVNPLDNLQVFYERNKKRINTIATIAVLAIAGFFVWRYLQGGKEDKAATQLATAQRYFEQDSLNLALNGDGQQPGFLRIIKRYGSTKAGNLSHYYAGMCYLRTGDFKQAIKHLEDFDGKGTVAGRAAEGALGDAYAESGSLKKAIDHYLKAAEEKDDVLLSPIYLYRAALAYEATGKPEDAKKAYVRIRDNYPTSASARDVDKNLARLGVLE